MKSIWFFSYSAMFVSNALLYICQIFCHYYPKRQAQFGHIQISRPDSTQFESSSVNKNKRAKCEIIFSDPEESETRPGSAAATTAASAATWQTLTGTLSMSSMVVVLSRWLSTLIMVNNGHRTTNLVQRRVSQLEALWFCQSFEGNVRLWTVRLWKVHQNGGASRHLTLDALCFLVKQSEKSFKTKAHLTARFTSGRPLIQTCHICHHIRSNLTAAFKSLDMAIKKSPKSLESLNWPLIGGRYYT